MNDLVVVNSEWQKLKALVLDGVSSPIRRRVYNMAFDEFFEWYSLEARPVLSKCDRQRLASFTRNARPRIVVDHIRMPAI